MFLELISIYIKIAGYKVNAKGRLLFHILAMNEQNLKLKTQYYLH